MNTNKDYKKTDLDKAKGNDANRDPITKEPGAHPVGTGVGAAAGGLAAAAAGAAAGAATGTVMGGPIGTAVGIVAGAVIGGLGGKAVAESVNPTKEDAYWRENHTREPYYDKNHTYDDYQGAYRTGYEGYATHAKSGTTYEQAEPKLQQQYETTYGKSKLEWEKARHAVRAAWNRFEHNPNHAEASDEQSGDVRNAASRGQRGAAEDIRAQEEMPRSQRQNEKC
jgi:hypothetical protein